MTPAEEKRLYVQLRVALNEISQRLDGLARTVSTLPPRRMPSPERVYVTTATALEEIRDAQYATGEAAESLEILQPRGEA